ncbi:MAG: TonB-dependent receptor [Elusimicrobiota bacterium]
MATKLNYLLILSFILIHVSTGYSYEITGKLYDSVTNIVLTDGYIEIYGTEKYAQTSADGTYVLTIQPTGHYLLSFHAMGYESKQTEVDVIADINLDVALHEGNVPSLNEIVVSAEKEKAVVSKQEVRKEEIQRAMKNYFDDPLKILQTMPGVVRANYFSSMMYVRGGEPWENAGVWDGIYLPVLYHYGGLLSVYNLSLIENIAFYTGAYPAIYGNALSSVINVNNRRGDYKKIKGSFTLGLISSSLNLEVPVPLLEESSFIIGMRRTYYDLLLNLLINKQGIMFPYYYDIQGNFTFKTGKSKFTLSGLYSFEEINMAVNPSTGIAAGVSVSALSLSETPVVSLQWLYKPAESFYLNLIAGWTKQYSKSDLSADLSSFSITDELNISATKVQYFYLYNYSTSYLYNVKPVFHFIPSEIQHLQAGIDVQQYPDIKEVFDMEYSYTNLNNRNRVVKTVMESTSTATLYCPFIQDEISLFNEKLTLLPGCRMTYLDFNGQTVTEPRFSAEYSISQNDTVKLAVGKVTQFIAEPRVLKDKDKSGLKLPEAWHYVAGYEKDIAEGVLLRTELFYKDYSNLILFESNNFNSTASNNMYGYSRGLELFVEKKKSGNTNLSGWISAALLDSRRVISSKLSSGSIIPVNEEFYPDQDRRFNMSIVVDWKISTKLMLYSEFDYTTGSPYTPITGATKRVYSSGNVSYQPVYGKYNSERLPDYHTLDVKLDYKFKSFGIESSCFLQVNNLYNHTNVMGYDYSRDYSVKTERSYLGLLIVTGLEFVW